MECIVSTSYSEDLCYYEFIYSQNNITIYSYPYTKQVTRLYLYYLLTPQDVTSTSSSLAINPSYFSDNIKSLYALEKTSYFKPKVYLQAAEFQVNNYEVLGLDEMHIIDECY